jgi:hypothetical protein
MKDKEVNPVVAMVGIVLLLLVAGGVWFFATNVGAGVPAPGAAGRADPMLSGPNSVMKGGMRRPGTPGGNQTQPSSLPGSPQPPPR